MSDLNLDFDSDHKKINLDQSIPSSNINLTTDDMMLGVELLANEKKTSRAPELNVTAEINGGYSSGEDSVKKSIKEDVNFFSDDKNQNNSTHTDPEVIPPPLMEDPISKNCK